MDIVTRELIVDALDILIVSYLLYKLFVLMRGTRAVHMFFGLIVLFVLSVIARWANLNALNQLGTIQRPVLPVHRMDRPCRLWLSG